MELMKAYKPTEVGLIPLDWDVVELKDVLIQNPQYGIGAAACLYSDLLPTYLRITDISEDGKFIQSNKASLNNHLSKNYILENGDIVFARTGATSGKSYLYDPKDGELVYAGFLIKVKPDKTKIDSYFLKSIVSSQPYWNWINVVSMRSGQPGINSNQLKKFQFQLPPLLEQKSIAVALSDVDSYINTIGKLIEKKRKIKLGALQKLLKPKNGWKEIMLTDAVDFIHGKAHEQYIIDNGFYTVVNSKFISSDGKVSKFSNYSFLTAKKNDILTVLSDLPNGKALAKCFFVDKDNHYAVNQRICIWRSRNTDPKFLFYLLNRHPYFMALNDGVSQTHILNHHIKKCKVSIPSNKTDQEIIGQILTSIDNELISLETKLEKAKFIKQGMMQNLLTGKIRLI